MDTLRFILERYGIEDWETIALPIEIHRRDTTFASLLGALGFTKGAEIGVGAGEYSKFLLDNIPKLKLLCIDPWLNYDGIDRKITESRQSNNYEVTKKTLAGYNCEIIKDFSMNIVKTVKDESLDFVFIDGNHAFQHVTNDIAEWSKKVRKGGIVSGHDFHRNYGQYLSHVQDVVEAWTRAYDIKPWFLIRKMEKRNIWFWVR